MTLKLESAERAACIHVMSANDSQVAIVRQKLQAGGDVFDDWEVKLLANTLMEVAKAETCRYRSLRLALIGNRLKREVNRYQEDFIKQRFGVTKRDSVRVCRINEIL